MIKSIYQVDFKPTVLVADSASAIKNGFDAVFDLVKRVHCWFHVKIAVDKEPNSIKDKEIRGSIKYDIIQLQDHVKISRSQDANFKRAAFLLVSKWNDKYRMSEYFPQKTGFIKYFSNQWLHLKRSGWYYHFLDHIPCTDNALESDNRAFKR